MKKPAVFSGRLFICHPNYHPRGSRVDVSDVWDVSHGLASGEAFKVCVVGVNELGATLSCYASLGFDVTVAAAVFAKDSADMQVGDV